MSNDKFSSTTSSTRREDRQPSSTTTHQYQSATAPPSSTSSTAAVRAKPEKKQPVFGRPLVPYFLEDPSSSADGELLINEQLELPEKLQALQKNLIVPNGNPDITVREFKDGYFEHKQLDLDNVLQSQHEVPNFVSGTSGGNSKGRDFETFATLNSSSAQLSKRASPAQKKKSEQMKHYDNYFNMVVKRADPNAQVNPVLAEAGISLDSNGTTHHENGSSANGFPKPPRSNTKAGQTPQRKPKRTSPVENTFKRERMSPTQFRMSPISSPSIATPEARIEPPKLITPQYILATANKNFTIGNSNHTTSQPSPFIGTYKVIEEGSSSDEYSDEDVLPNNGYKTPSPPDTARQLTYTPVRPEVHHDTFHSSASPFNTHLPPTYPHSMPPPRLHVPLPSMLPPPVPESSPVVPYPHVASEMTEAQLLESLQQLSAPSSSKLNALKKTAAAASASHTPHAGGAWSNSPPASSLPIIPESWRKRIQ